MKVFAVSCNSGRAERLITAASPLGIDFVIVPSPLKDDPEVLWRGRRCLEEKTSYATGIAATIGHVRCMQEFLKTGDPLGIIIEDDVRFRKDFLEVVDRVSRSFYDVDVISLGYVNMPYGNIDDAIGMIRYVGLGNPWGAQCYMLSRQYAQKFVDRFSGDDLLEAYAGHFVTDWVIFDPAIGCRRHALSVPICVEDPTEPTIAGSDNKPDLWTFIDKSQFYL